MRRSRNARLNEMARTWNGPYRPYDLVKEVAIATAVIALIAVAMTILFSSPDEKPSTIKSWSRNMPVDFLTTATAELDGTSDTATYGPPYNHNGEGQHVAFIHLQEWLGVSHPIDTAYDYVIEPLRSIPNDPALSAEIDRYAKASKAQQQAWTGAYAKALEKASSSGTAVSVPAGEYGPVGPMMASLLGLAQSGGVDGALLTSRQFYQTDYTLPLLFLADVPGFMVGTAVERQGIIRHGAKMIAAMSDATVPKICVVVRKAYGAGYYVMCGRAYEPDLIVAWPSAEISVMGAEGVVEIAFRKVVDAAEDPDAKRAELIESFKKMFDVYIAAGNDMIDDIIDPRETRLTICRGLEMAQGKKMERPYKKHGVVPV